MTSMISDYPKKVPPVVADFGWYYGVQPLASHATVKQTNFVVNPSFEYDVAGHTPSGWSATNPPWFLNPGATLTVIAGGQVGSNALRVVTTNALSQEGGAISLGVLPAGVYSASCYAKGNAGGEALTLEGGIISPGTGNGNNNFTATTNFVRQSVSFTSDGVTTSYALVKTQSATAVTFFVDAVMVVRGPSALTYGDGDSSGWAWSGAQGGSGSIDQKDDFVTPLQQVITFDAIDQQSLGMPTTITPTGVSIVDYKWDFGNGQVGHGPFASTTYNYSKPPPDMQVSLTVTDSHNRMYSCAHRLNLQALTPTYATSLRERG